MKAQISMFDEGRFTIHESIAVTLASLREYGARYNHWALAFSGGKDSTATLTIVAHLLESGQLAPPQTLTVLYADTRMELPPLHYAAMQVLAEVERRGLAQTKVVLPQLDRRFYVYLFGRGVPPSHSGFRWCTGSLKVEPMNTALKQLRDERGEKFLMLTGVRLGESAQRDARITLSCSKDSGECGQGYFQQMTPKSIADVLAPIVHWRTCFVWDWLMGFEGSHGFDTQDVATVYGQDAEGSTLEKDARTGCVGCPVASRDTALDTVLKSDSWKYLQPLKELRGVYDELSRSRHRLKRTATTNGPLLMESRRWGLNRILEIQAQVNEAAKAHGRPPVILIDGEELARIEELMAANTWPDGWIGNEMRGDVILPIMPTKGGGMQHTMVEWFDEVPS